MSETVLYRTHKFDEFVKLSWKQLKKQTKNHCILYDATGKDGLTKANSFNFTLDDYKNSGYPLASQKQIQDLPAYQKIEKHQREKLDDMNWQIYFNPEYAILLYFREHPNFDFYWSMEYDVFFNGNWEKFFGAARKDSSDLLACYLRNFYEETPYNELWDGLNFDVTPGQHKICYGPVMRFSNDALRTLDREYRAGKHGFGETAVPSILELNGLVCRDINCNGKFYSPVTFGADNIRESWTHEVFKRHENYMFHPFRKN